MKSSENDLKMRGFPAEDVIVEIAGLSAEEYIRLLASPQADIRSAAAIHLRPVMGGATDAPLSRATSGDAADILLGRTAADGATDALLECLAVEKCLYTRIAICETLEKGDLCTARRMVQYLGKIGRNQHRQLPDKVSAKKSFPLPRDIIARTLGRMDISVYPVMEDVLVSGDLMKMREVLDAIGYMVFYNPKLATEANVAQILAMADFDDIILVWKMLLCLSAFPLPESLKVLENFSGREDILGQEAMRSIRMIKRSMKRLDAD